MEGDRYTKHMRGADKSLARPGRRQATATKIGSLDMLPFSLCTKKRLTIRYINRPPLSNDIIDSVLCHREVGRAKDLSARPRRERQLSWVSSAVLSCAKHPTIWHRTVWNADCVRMNHNILRVNLWVYFNSDTNSRGLWGREAKFRWLSDVCLTF